MCNTLWGGVMSMVVIAVFSCAADAEGTHEVVDVGECVDVCYGWVSGLTGLHLPSVILVIKLYTNCNHNHSLTV